ncbi:hypothetical protein [Streptomyces sp. MA5143a]|uniref:hypothetical protein n=1 Tax=Streptomyces sp. MA5143a TaxID=2083010 RepID=UPI0011B1D4FB|nr:hypothetical protein [Streptomyces sp. MA5143a]
MGTDEPNQAELIAKAAALEIEDLYIEIGKLSDFGVSEPSPGELLRLGRLWVAENWENLRNSICPQRDAINTAGDSAATASALLPFLGSIASETAGVIVAALVAKIGVQVFCRGFDERGNSE